MYYMITVAKDEEVIYKIDKLEVGQNVLRRLICSFPRAVYTDIASDIGVFRDRYKDKLIYYFVFSEYSFSSQSHANLRRDLYGRHNSSVCAWYQYLRNQDMGGIYEKLKEQAEATLAAS